MASSQEKPWSDNPNAPKISYDLYFYEKAALARAFISSILYGTPERPLLHVRTSRSLRLVGLLSGWFILGIAIMLFFQCMVALFSPVPRRGEYVKWGLVLYAAVMFLLVTVFTAPNLKILSISYIDNRRFPGVQGVLPPEVYGQIVHCSQGAQYHLYHHVRLEQLVSQRSFVFDSVFTHPGV